MDINEDKAENTPAGGVLVGKRDGQTIIHDKGTMSGYLVGKLHKDGGIKAVNKATGQPLEMQGGEIVITAPAVSDTTKREFEGKMMTNREILSAINEKGGGVSFAEGGEVPERFTPNGASYNYGGKTMTDHEILKAMNGSGHLSKNKSLKQIAQMHNVSLAHVNEELAKGLEVEKEHFADFKERTRVAKDHLVENPNYYTILSKAGLKNGGRFNNGGSVSKENKITFDNKSDVLKSFYKTNNPSIDNLLIECQPFINELIEQQKKLVLKLTLNTIGVETPMSESEIERYEIGLIFKMVQSFNKYLKTRDFLTDVTIKNVGLFEISATVIRDGKKYSFRTELIPAGGYNIQEFHYRYITKTDLPESKENSAIDNLKSKLSVFKKIKSLEDDINRNIKSISDLEKYIKQGYYGDDDDDKLYRVDLNKEAILYEQENIERYKKEIEKLKIKQNDLESVLISLNKLKNGGHILSHHRYSDNLAKDAKKGDTPARDLNNYNDVMDLGADEAVGGDSGLAFANGGDISKIKRYSPFPNSMDINENGDWVMYDEVKDLASFSETDKYAYVGNGRMMQSPYGDWVLYRKISYADGGITPYDANLDGDSLDVNENDFAKGGVVYDTTKPKLEKVTIKETKYNRASVIGRNASTISDLQFIVRDYLDYSPKDIDWIKFYVNDNTRGGYYINLNKGKKNTVANVNPETLNSANFKRVIDANTYLVKNYDWTDFFEGSAGKTKAQVTSSTKTPLTKEELFRSRIWIGDDVNLKKRVIQKLEEIGIPFDKRNGNADANESIDINIFDSDFVVYKESKEVFDTDTMRKEIFPEDLGIDVTTMGVVTTTPNTSTPASTSTQPFDFSMTKIDVSNDPDLSQKVQKRAFENGWEWENGGGKTIDYNSFNYMYFTKTSISYGNTYTSFVNSPKREITEEEIFGNQTPTASTSAYKADKEVQSVLIKYDGNEYTALNEESLLSMMQDIWDSKDKTIKITPQSRISALSSDKIIHLVQDVTNEAYQINPDKITLDELRDKLSKDKNFYDDLDWSDFFKNQNQTSDAKVDKVILDYNVNTSLSPKRNIICNNGYELLDAYKLIEEQAEGDSLEVKVTLKGNYNIGRFFETEGITQEVGQGGFEPSQIYSFEEFEEFFKNLYRAFNFDNFFSGVTVANRSVSSTKSTTNAKPMVESVMIGWKETGLSLEEKILKTPEELFNLLKEAYGLKLEFINIQPLGSNFVVGTSIITDRLKEIILNNSFEDAEAEFMSELEFGNFPQLDFSEFITNSNRVANSNSKPKVEKLYTANGDVFSNIEQVRYFLDNRTVFVDKVFFNVNSLNSQDVFRVELNDVNSDYYYNKSAGLEPKYRKLQDIFELNPAFENYDWEEFFSFFSNTQTQTNTIVNKPIIEPYDVYETVLIWKDNSGKEIIDSMDIFNGVSGAFFISRLKEIEEQSQGKDVNVIIRAFANDNDGNQFEKNDSFTISRWFKPSTRTNEQIKSVVEKWIDGVNFDKYFADVIPLTTTVSAQPFDLSKTKIKVGADRNLSKKIQEKAFELGWGWGSEILKDVQSTGADSLFFDENKQIDAYYSDAPFEEAVDYREITADELFGFNAPTAKYKYINLSQTKIWIGDDIEVSKQVQERAFELGWSWKKEATPKSLYWGNKPALYFDRYNEISYGDDRKLFDSNKDFREITFKDLFEKIEPALSGQTPTVNGSSGSVQEIKDLKEAVGVLEGIASQASQKYNTKKYEENLELLKEVKEEYSLALSFTPESSFMYERIELMKKIAEIQKEITRITELKNGGAYYILSKVVDRLERAENWKELGNGQIMINEVPQQEIDTVIYTEKFKNWFGDWEQALITKEYDYVSKAITESGKPCVMYHGAKRIKYSYRQVSNGVVYLAENRSYAEWFSATDSPYQKQGDYLTQCFVNLKNPIDLTPFGVEEVDLRDIIQYIDALYPLAKIYDVLPPNTAMAIMNNQLIGRNFRAWYIIRQFPELNKHIRDNTTYDGFIYYENNPSDMIPSESGEMVENVTKATAVFNSNQVKLVDAMLFDSSLDDWRFETGGKVN